MTPAVETAILEPPAGFFSSLKFLGPGFILSAAIVGSGELIATTALGARAGFVLLWVVLVSCTMKVAVQLEYGRYAIAHGRASLEAWNATAGPRAAGVHWSVYAGLLFLFSTFIGAGGILGSAAQVLGYAFPRLPLPVCAAALAAAASLLVFHGRYGPVELIAGVLNAVFLGAVLYTNGAVLGTPYAYGLRDLLSGLTFRLPPEGWTLALAVIGITGVGAGEIVMYPSWCLEKGYAAFVGPADGSPEWVRRARGWTRVMRIDALLSLAVYTTATCGFYLLGAAVLRPQGAVADGSALVWQLSATFTRVLGEGSRGVFMVCALTVLFGTLFSNTAGLSRLWADVFGICRIIEPGDRRQRRRAIAALAWVLPATWAATFLLVRKPLFMVVFMGISNALFLLVVAWQALVFRYRHTDARLEPGRVYDAALWLSILLIGFAAARIVQSAAG